ncbi:MAG TPA: hypothetical protein VFR03_06435 [Thermoanaerobaculia bacterium]|nr:hypothetical protein [Thermoanaerobaculia bacterium]
MMGRALLIIGVVATLGFVATGILGYWVTGPAHPDMARHMLLALGSCLLLLFSHLWILFYLVGIGRAIRLTIQDLGLEPGLSEATRRFKRCYPWLLLATAAALATFILGGFVATRALPRWTHHSLFFVTLALQVVALWLEGRALAGSEGLIGDVDRLAARLTERPPAAEMPG